MTALEWADVDLSKRQLCLVCSSIEATTSDFKGASALHG